jgi:hypothetical protein
LPGTKTVEGGTGREYFVLEDDYYGAILVARVSGKMFGVVGYRPALDPQILEFRDAILNSTD